MTTAPLCIYSVLGAEISRVEWPARLKHIHAMGFTHVLASSAAFKANTGETAVNVDAAAAGTAAPDLLLLQAAARVCADHELRLLLDVDVTCAAAGASLRAQHPEWFRAILSAADLPDPRRRPAEAGLRWRLDDARGAQAALAWWGGHLLECARTGVAGFRLVSVDAAPAAWWQALCTQVHAHDANTRMLAWTQGLRPQVLSALVGTGFDYTFCSAEWWDFRAAWLAEEYRRLAAVAAPLACAGAPLPLHPPAVHTLRAQQRAVWLAATLGAGWLMPAGFESRAEAPGRGSSQPSGPAEEGDDDVAAALVLQSDVAAANALVAAERTDANALAMLHAGVGWAAVLRAGSGAARLVVLNANLDQPTVASIPAVAGGAACAFSPWRDGGGREVSGTCTLAPGQTLRLAAVRAQTVTCHLPGPALLQALDAATCAP
ncbi:MAG: hypothetical protein ABI300_08430, partial [Rhodanobacter sp.]